ncbi:type II toxin-antitoxin system prevent-host-death family antitoxin [Furfurilactobacillus milii]|uniref:Antitoxin n=1 Tax=Furfurilactobacillus rossiae TaxID=231049 RepID=A0A7C9IUZ7_9LACO|nr:type II toxin-antitoxin system prevent-host-death family antitoxin [Furfurilactobacillus milii]MYV06296.1 type II toxin-antitoxin system prevent-host-death family antitoxin [Furfurilactobacillus milii]
MVNSQKNLNIRPVSELRTYNKVLNQVGPDSPVILTKNGYGKYVLLDLEDYEKYETRRISEQLLADIEKSEQGRRHKIEDVRKEFLDK